MKTQCPSCKGEYPIKAGQIGHKVKCPKCQSIFKITAYDDPVDKIIYEDRENHDRKTVNKEAKSEISPNNHPRRTKVGFLTNHFGFREMIACGVIKFAYSFVFFASLIIAVACFISAFSTGFVYWPAVVFIFPCWVIFIIIFRISCEFSILFFSMHERLNAIETELKK